MDWRESEDRQDEQVRTNVVIVYDTARMGRRAMQALRSALDRAREARPAVELRLWRLDLLADRESREMADADVGKADMLFFAIEAADSLPPAMDSWLRVLGNKETGARGLALMIGNNDRGSDGPSRHALDDLRSRAEAGRIDFLTNISDLPDAPHRQITSLGDTFAARRALPIFDGFEHCEPSRGWGIND
jgi:hypothetical protein